MGDCGIFRESCPRLLGLDWSSQFFSNGVLVLYLQIWTLFQTELDFNSNRKRVKETLERLILIVVLDEYTHLTICMLNIFMTWISCQGTTDK